MTLDVGRLVLVRGGNEAGAGFSAMEAVAFAAGEAWSERPRCSSPAITEWMIAWNDGLDDRSRQELRRYIWRLVGSKGTPAQERVRRWIAADWLVRAYAPAWLASAGLTTEAQRMAELPTLRGPRDVDQAWSTCTAGAIAGRRLRDDTWREAALALPGAEEWGTAGAVWSAIADATWAAAGSAARAVVWSSTDAMGPGSAKAAVWDAVSDAASDAAAAIAWRAVALSSAAAGGASAAVVDADAGWRLAQEAAGAALSTTGAALQASAHVVVERLLAVTETHNSTVLPFETRPRSHRRARRPRRGWPR